MRSGKNGSDAGASNVIGFILITGIALVAVTMVLLGGGPAIRQLQANQESEAFLGYMGDLHAEVSGLITGSPASTTPTWRFSMAQGSVALDESGHLWGYAVDLSPDDQDWHFEYGDLHDGTHQIQVAFTGGATDMDGLAVTAKRIDASATSTVDVAVTPVPGNPGPWTLTLTQGGKKYYPDGNVTEFLLSDSDGTPPAPVARFYLLESGAMVWRGDVGQIQTVAYENTGIVGSRDDGQVMLNQPSVRPPQWTDNDNTKQSVYLRVVRLEGEVSVGGRTGASVLLTSAGNQQHFSTSSAERIAIYPPAAWSQAWERTLTDVNLGYDFTAAGTNAVGSGTWRVYHDKAAQGLTTLSGTLVETTVRAEVD